MDKRRIAVLIAIGAVAALCFAVLHPRGHLVLPMIGERAAAQTADPTLILVKSLPNTGGNDEDPWHRFEITVPPTTPPLDMHVAYLVDGKGMDYITMQSSPWPQSLLLKLRLDQDDDTRVKAILKAQGLPVNQRLVTYHFAYQSIAGISDDKTLNFLHSSDAMSGIEVPSQAGGDVGDKIMLYQSVAFDDTAYHSPAYRPSDDWTSDHYAAKFAPGFVHQFTVYLQFQQHHGPLLKNVTAFDDHPI